MSIATDQRRAVNGLLMRHGLAPTGQPAALLPQLAYLIEGHDEFRTLLTKCEPEQRTAMYESLRPNLRFTPKPLDVYLSEAAGEAEARQLPIVGPDGRLRAFSPPDVWTTAQRALETATAAGHLELVCRKCTRAEVFPGTDRADAIQKARLAGWTYNELSGDGREICPQCP